MKDFKKLLKEYKNLIKDYNKGVKKIADSPENLSSQEVQLFGDSLKDIYEEVKLPENRALILQEILHDVGAMRTIKLSGSHNVVNLLETRVLLAGFKQNVDKDFLRKFALHGDTGFADLKYKMIENVVERERAGINYQPEEPSL